MPIFEYACRGCGHRFEEIVLGAPREPRCPACGGGEAERQLSVFAAHGGRAAEPAVAPCGQCGDPRGAGSCRAQ